MEPTPKTKEEPVAEQDKTNIQDPEYKLPSRLASYPAVASALETAKEYYNWGKEVSPVVAYAESTLEGGVQWLAPKVEPLLETAKVISDLINLIGSLSSIKQTICPMRPSIE
jgi:hypothetical protein